MPKVQLHPAQLAPSTLPTISLQQPQVARSVRPSERPGPVRKPRRPPPPPGRLTSSSGLSAYSLGTWKGKPLTMASSMAPTYVNASRCLMGTCAGEARRGGRRGEASRVRHTQHTPFQPNADGHVQVGTYAAMPQSGHGLDSHGQAAEGLGTTPARNPPPTTHTSTMLIAPQRGWPSARGSRPPPACPCCQ